MVLGGSNVSEHSASASLEIASSVAVMGAKSMGTSWLDVAATAIESDDALMFWVDAARDSAAG